MRDFSIKMPASTCSALSILVLLSVTPASSQETNTNGLSIPAILKDKGNVDAIVMFKEKDIIGPDGEVTSMQSTSYLAQSLDQTESEKIQSLGDGGATFVTLDQESYAKLLQDPQLALVAPVNTYTPALIETEQLIGIDATSADNTDSADNNATSDDAIVVLDTGVDGEHPFLKGKVVAQACFSQEDATEGIHSLCPGGQQNGELVTDLSPNSGKPCDSAVSGCGHGTHVAGIIAGNRVQDPRNPGGYISGVNPAVNIIAIQVYSKYENKTDCSTALPAPCAKTSDVSLIQALDYVQYLELQRRIMKTGPKIVGVNMSLAAGRRVTPCDTTNPLTRSIENLKNLGIPTFIASGNNGEVYAVAEPGCISTAFTVAASTKSSKLWSRSNRAASSMIDAVAPGVAVFSSMPNGNFEENSGTSMATGVVAAEFSILVAKFPNRSVKDILTALANSGSKIRDDATSAELNFADLRKVSDILDDNSEISAVSDTPIQIDGGVVFNESMTNKIVIELGSQSEPLPDVVNSIRDKSKDIAQQIDAGSIVVDSIGRSNIILNTRKDVSIGDLVKSLDAAKIQGIGAVFPSQSYAPFE